MKTTILLPHYKTREMTAYTVSKILACRGRHEANIIVIDNGNGDGVNGIPRHPDVQVITYPTHLLQTHGVAFDYALKTVPHLIEECFITVESDSFPVDSTWLDHYEDYKNLGFDIAGSRMKLSGGTYIHPAGCMYRKSNWLEAMRDVMRYKANDYHFYESLIPPCYHVMRKGLIDGDEAAEAKRVRFLPISEGVFHNGMGFQNEDVSTYGQRTPATEAHSILPRDGDEQYLRVMYEPGQWFSYWHYVKCKNIKEVPTEIRWLEGRPDQNQEYTLMENGLKHLWGITAYSTCETTDPEILKVIEFKKKQAEEVIGKAP